MTPASILTGLRARAASLAYLVRAGAAPGTLWAWARTQAYWQLRPGRFLRLRDAARQAERGDFSTDWFTQNAPHWMAVFDRAGLRGRPLKVLEIGCWEGRSTCFMLQQLPEARLTAVDTWRGSDENGGKAVSVEARFNANVRRFGRRVTKFKGTSLAFFAAPRAGREDYDLAYVDGSHRADDVLCDALLAFDRLRPGGVMVLDDYGWRYYPELRKNPAPAVNAFLRLKRGGYRLLFVDYQLYLQKTGDGLG